MDYTSCSLVFPSEIIALFSKRSAGCVGVTPDLEVGEMGVFISRLFP